MKTFSAPLNNIFKTFKVWAIVALSLISLLLIFEQITWAQNEPFKINGKEVREYLMEKYELHKVHKDDLTSTLQQTPHGPSGKLHIRGNIKPKKVVITEETIEGRARAIAKAFLEEEVNLLGITNMDEIREIWIDAFTSPITNLTTTNVYYQRYINNLELEYAYIRITIGPNENISSVSAELVLAPPELYEAVKKKTLIEAEIRRIVEDDLKAAAESHGTTPFEKSIARNWLPYIKTMEMKKHAISSPPYVVWKAESGWVYTIDAFTGKILDKEPNWRKLR